MIAYLFLFSTFADWSTPVNKNNKEREHLIPTVRSVKIFHQERDDLLYKVLFY